MTQEVLEPEVVEWLAYGNAYAMARRLATAAGVAHLDPPTLAEEVASRLEVSPGEGPVLALAREAVEDALAGRRPRL